jgi:tRNA-specific 2-thiouridylase
MKDFLAERLPKKTGNIYNLGGEIIGKHEGAHFYTIGQRKGIDIGG